VTVPKALRRLISEQARNFPEYCLLGVHDSYTPHQVDQIVSQKHNGPADSENLTCAGERRNSYKDLDLLAIDPKSHEAVTPGSITSICAQFKPSPSPQSPPLPPFLITVHHRSSPANRLPLALRRSPQSLTLLRETPHPIPLHSQQISP
jgi:hypothetical protein